MKLDSLPEVEKRDDSDQIIISKDGVHLSKMTAKNFGKGLGGGGKGLEYWTETEEEIYKDTDGETVDPNWQIEEVYSPTYGTLLRFRVFGEKSVDNFNISTPTQRKGTNNAKAAAMSLCYPGKNANKEQPDNFAFTSHYYRNDADKPEQDTYSEFGDTPFVKIPAYGISLDNLPLYPTEASMPLLNARVQEYRNNDWYSAVAADNEYGSNNTPQYGSWYTYCGYVNLHIYNSKAYGDIAGLRGYHKDFSLYTVPAITKAFASIRKSAYDSVLNPTEYDVLWVINDFIVSFPELISEATPEQLKNEIEMHISTIGGDKVESDLITRIRACINNYQSYSSASDMAADVENIISESSYTFETESVYYNRKNTESQDLATSIRTLILSDPSFIENQSMKQIKDLCDEFIGVYHNPSQVASFFTEINEIVEPIISLREMWKYTTSPYYNCSDHPKAQPDENYTYKVSRDHESDYLDFDRDFPFVFKVLCLGRLFENKNKGYVAGETPAEDIYWPDDPELISVTDIEPFIKEVLKYEIIDLDVDDNDRMLYNRINFTDRSMAQGGIIMDGEGIAWYVFLAPAKRMFYWLDGIQDSDEPYFDIYGVTTGYGVASSYFKTTKTFPAPADAKPGKEEHNPSYHKKFQFLDIGETNHWSYYYGANPSDNVVSHIYPHNCNGHTYTYEVDELSEVSKTVYANNFASIARKIVNALNLMAIKPYFGEKEKSVQTRTKLVSRNDNVAFSAGVLYSGTDGYVPKIEINAETGDIVTDGSIEMGGKELQTKLNAGAGITIENDTISASGGGGGGGGGGASPYPMTEEIIGTWNERPNDWQDRNIYRITYYIELSGSETQKIILLPQHPDNVPKVKETGAKVYSSYEQSLVVLDIRSTCSGVALGGYSPSWQKLNGYNHSSSYKNTLYRETQVIYYEGETRLYLDFGSSVKAKRAVVTVDYVG